MNVPQLNILGFKATLDDEGNFFINCRDRSEAKCAAEQLWNLSEEVFRRLDGQSITIRVCHEKFSGPIPRLLLGAA